MSALPEPFYDRDGITIYCGDCRAILPTLDVSGVGLVLTDPPYGIAWSRGIHAARNSKPHDGIANDHDTSARDEVLEMLGGIPALVFGSFYAPYPANTKQVLVWAKPLDSGVVGSTTGYRRDAEPVFLVGPWPQRRVRWSSVLRSHAGSMSAVATETGHPHTKPIGLIRALMAQAPDGVVLDPFMGSGTTLRAAMDLGRRAIGIEIEPKYCEVAVRRLQQSVLPLEVPA
jgi:site-specific DNA-methyltransferase (adenine-specific)